MRVRIRAVLLALLLCAACLPVPAARAETVDLLLALVTDVSRSVDDQEYELQKKGYLTAFTDPRVIAASKGGVVERIVYVATVVALWKKDYARWAFEGDRVLALNPNLALAMMTRGMLPIYTGELRKAIPYIERAMRLDPAPQHGQYVHFLATAWFVAGAYEKAASCF